MLQCRKEAHGLSVGTHTPTARAPSGDTVAGPSVILDQQEGEEEEEEEEEERREEGEFPVADSTPINVPTVNGLLTGRSVEEEEAEGQATMVHLPST